MPETRYVRAGDAEIAYQTIGSGPVDLVWAYGMLTHLEVKWEEPSLAAMLRELSRFSRLILFDRRGCGLSDRGDRHLSPTLEERVEDVVAVLDAVGSQQASFFGVSEGCGLAALFASMHPERTHRLVLYGGISRLLRDAEHPWGVMDAAAYDAAFAPVFRQWGTLEGAAAMVGLVAPSAAGDRDYLAWFARQQRLSLSRDAVVRFMATVVAYDLDAVFPSVHVPTLVLHRSGDTVVPLSSPRRLASRIPGARLVELPGTDHLPYVGDSASVVEAVRAFLGAAIARAPASSRLVTLLVTDARTPAAVALVRRHVRRMDGAEVTSPSGEELVWFDSATRALRCAMGALRAAHAQGIELRAVVHAGECEVGRGSVDGAPVVVPTALLRQAPAGRVLATATVRDIVPGSDITLTDPWRVRLPGTGGVLTVTTAAAGETLSAGGVGGGGGHGGGAERVFRKDGEYWTLAFEGRTVRLRDSKGMADLMTLLAAPGRERHVLDLVAGTPGTSAVHAALHRSAPQPVIDAQARGRYRQRLAEVDEALGGSDVDTVVSARLLEEKDWLLRELTAAYGLGDRARAVPDEVERARKAVYRRVADALRRVEQAHPGLGRHLRCSVHTGVYCSYDPERDLAWTTGRQDPQTD
ncbi:alpha/beta fold hydrolase [Nocardioides sp. 31GB23]|uniref:alpha/beta fold hydrolase n=1 Tax=Nocardioides sp. 31GB23 TaxID=3156065 RepID=UPI0032AF6E25